MDFPLNRPFLYKVVLAIEQVRSCPITMALTSSNSQKRPKKDENPLNMALEKDRDSGR